MRFAAAYYLLLIYTMVIVEPLIPAAANIFSHSFAKAWHISTVHATQGNDHVEKEMAVGTDAGSNTDQKADKTEQTIHEPPVASAISFEDPYPFIYKYPFTNEPLSNIYVACITPPPRMIP